MTTAATDLSAKTLCAADLDDARRALACLDLTDLSDDASEAGAERLCARAVTPFGPVAAVCLWPRFVTVAKRALTGTPVKVATVVNFPAGGEKTLEVVEEAKRAAADGADEVDLVIPWRAVSDARPGFAETQVHRVRAALPAHVRLKAILETGELVDPALIRIAADAAIAGGADFLKTSTGKTKVSATPEAVAVLIDAIRAAPRPVALKVSGGVRTLADAKAYLAQVDAGLGAGWATPATFRFGASGLLDALTAALAGSATPKPAAGY
ncbi:deoxyribose-phosphate aldolase [Pseudoxanthobacter sp. M-2]|uniref:deoxyribose-phosphate aldolase n=1 Tax=Pseudoxanthobacter sp. M-2 TaxID=3078754 RepID=UPI0038FCCC4E